MAVSSIDKPITRVVARVLVWLMLCQPVYVAMAMDLEVASDANMNIFANTTSTHNDGVVNQELQHVSEGKESNVSDAVQDDDETISPETETGREGSEADAFVVETSALDVVNTPVALPVVPDDARTTDDDVGDVVPNETHIDLEYGDNDDSHIPNAQEGDVSHTDGAIGVVDYMEVSDVVTHDASSDADDSGTVAVVDNPVVSDDADVSLGDVSDPSSEPSPSEVTPSMTADAGTDGGLSQEVPDDTYAPEGDALDSASDPLPSEVTPSVRDATNAYTFGRSDCTLVTDGEYYCISPTTPRHVPGEPRVYAEKDREGDLEIFYFDGVEVKRITNNSYDDLAPAYDAETKRIVWQANIADRMRIMAHDIMKGETREITSGRQNASNPAILGDTVVWQEWVDTNWEIMMTNVNNNGAPFEIERLTDNAVHDMFPRVYNGMVTWQSERGSGWEVVVYNLHTGMRHNLEKKDATKYENPRFVLLFDSKHDNGDVETIGYDLDTGEMMELGTRANPQPGGPVSPKSEIPDVPVQTTASSMYKVKATGDSDDDDDDTDRVVGGPDEPRDTLDLADDVDSVYFDEEEGGGTALPPDDVVAGAEEVFVEERGAYTDAIEEEYLADEEDGGTLHSHRNASADGGVAGMVVRL